MMQEIPVYTYSSFKTFFMWNRDVFLSARNIPNGINIKIFSMTYAFSCVDAPHVENNCKSTPTLDPGSLEKMLPYSSAIYMQSYYTTIWCYKPSTFYFFVTGYLLEPFLLQPQSNKWEHRVVFLLNSVKLLI